MLAHKYLLQHLVKNGRLSFADSGCNIAIMKQTEELTVINDLSLKQYEVVVHPNDGYDLGLLDKHNYIKVFSGNTLEEFNKEDGRYMPGQLSLANECRTGTVIINSKHWNSLGKPKKIKLFYNDKKLLIAD